jgi:transcriptional regulator with XRE-family HTH domain
MDRTINTIGKNIRSLRHKQGWSQAEVASRLGISIPAFSKIETGITDINISRLCEIATLFNVHALDILSADENHPVALNMEKFKECKIELNLACQDIIKLQKRVIGLLDENRGLNQKLKQIDLD